MRRLLIANSTLEVNVNDRLDEKCVEFDSFRGCGQWVNAG